MIRMNIKVMLQVVVSLFILLLISSCGTESTDQQTENEDEQSVERIEYPEVDENPIVTITMVNDEQIILELFPDVAPNTVANFIALIEDSFYDELIFHRIIADFMIQGGDPRGNGSGGPGYSIPGEFSSNGFENNLEHHRGILSMARSQHPDSAGSQFFIMVADSPHLDGDYAGFGQVIEGMEAVDAIVLSDELQLMKTVVVDTKGYEYPDPLKQ